MNCYGPEFNIEDITTEVVAAAISSQSYDLAVEWFDTCRRRAWKETLQLRQGPLADLRSLDPHLADHLEQIAHELDQSNESGVPHVEQQRRRLVSLWETTLEHIRSLPGFERFLQPTSAELVRAARSGAVVVVNAHRSRCDALIIRPGQDTISHVRPSKLCYQKAVSARYQLAKILGNQDLPERKCQTERDSERVFEEILEML
ncbi:hypothetical protein FRC06_003479 [Ceratobasidium sp. 370]|nr:hypothetical protein FRC06_003479 [Ceratobasidium sp. 370]